MRREHLLVVNLDLASVDALDDSVGVLAVDGAADGLGGTKDLLDGTGKALGERLEAHLAGNLDNLVERDVATVLDVLLLLAVSGLCQKISQVMTTPFACQNIDRRLHRGEWVGRCRRL